MKNCLVSWESSHLPCKALAKMTGIMQTLVQETSVAPIYLLDKVPSIRKIDHDPTLLHHSHGSLLLPVLIRAYLHHSAFSNMAFALQPPGMLPVLTIFELNPPWIPFKAQLKCIPTSFSWRTCYMFISPPSEILWHCLSYGITYYICSNILLWKCSYMQERWKIV